MQFPTVSGKNLEGQSYTLPGDFGSPYNVVLVAFEQEQQYDVYTWGDFLKTLQQQYPALGVYEVPTVPRFPWYQRMMLDYWMRTGIPDPKTRRTTITLYTDQQAFLQALDLPGMNSIYTLLVDREGNVYWKTAGAFTSQLGQQLQQAVAARLAVAQ